LLSHTSILARKKTPWRMQKAAADRFFNLSIDLLCIASLDGYFKRLNPTWEKTLGYTPSELMSVPYLEFVHPEDREATIAEAKKLETGIDSISFENRYLCKDGSYKWLLWTAAPFTEEGLIYAVARDITESKIAEAELRDLSIALANAVEGISRLDSQGRYITVNKAYANTAGYQPEEMIGMEWVLTVHPEDQEKLIEAYEQMLRDGKVEAEARGVRKDGSVFYKQVVMVSAYDCQQRFIGHHCFLKDITERKQMEQELKQANELLELRVEARTAQLEQTVQQLKTEISDRKHAQKALAKQERTLRTILDHAPIWIWMKDPNGKVLFANKTFCNNLGISETDFLQLNPDRAIAPEEAANCCASDAACWSQESPYRCEEIRRFVDGDLHYLEITKAKIKDEQGQPIGLIGLAVDATLRKQQAEKLQRSEAKYKKLAKREALINQIASDIRKSLDVNTILETVVQEVQTFLQVDRCNFIWYQPQTNSPSLKVVKEAKKPGLKTHLGTYPIEINSVLERLLNLEILRSDDLKNSNNLEWQTLSENWAYSALLSIPIKTPDGEIGLLSCGHNEPRHWSDDEVELLRAVTDQLAIALHQAELYTAAQNAAKAAQQRANERKEALYRLQQTQSQLIQTEKMSSLGQLVAGVAHEINNPINFIYGNLIHAEQYTKDILKLLELYQQYYPNPHPEILELTEAIELDFIVEDLPKLLGSMKMGSERICQIVLSLRNFSRLDEADMKAVDIHEGIDNSLLILQNRLKAKLELPAIEIIKNYGKLPKIECYAGQLNQVFMNLLNNGIDALEEYRGNQDVPTPPPQIKISTEITNNNRLVVKIADNGPGMTEKIRARLFDPFFTTKPVGKGTGLGLSISYQIVVEKHKGSLECKSVPGEGAEFQIEIPICQKNC
jgi:two-component system, NtrC family, sensor kinase